MRTARNTVRTLWAVGSTPVDAISFAIMSLAAVTTFAAVVRLVG